MREVAITSMRQANEIESHFLPAPEVAGKYQVSFLWDPHIYGFLRPCTALIKGCGAKSQTLRHQLLSARQGTRGPGCSIFKRPVLVELMIILGWVICILVST